MDNNNHPPPHCITQDDAEEEEHHNEKPCSSDSSPSTKPSSNAPPSRGSGWLSRLSTPSPRNSTKNYHSSSANKIVVGSRVMKRIGEPVERDLTPTGRKRRAFVGGTVIGVGSVKSKWKVKFDNATVLDLSSKQITFQHNNYVHNNVLKTKVSDH